MFGKRSNPGLSPAQPTAAAPPPARVETILAAAARDLLDGEEAAK